MIDDPKPTELAKLRILARAAMQSGAEVRIRVDDLIHYCRVLGVEHDAIVVRDRGAYRGEERIYFDAVLAIELLGGGAP